MRITHIITRLIVGGAQENTIATVLGLRQRFGEEVTLLSGPTDGPEGSLEPLVTSAPGLLQIVPDLTRPVHPWKDLHALVQLTRWLRERRPVIVHTHSGKAGILGRLAARRAGVPIIVHTIHGPSFGPFQGPVPNLLFTAAERWAGHCTTQFVSVSQAMTDQYLAAGIGTPAQYRRIFSGFPLDPYLKAVPNVALRARLGIAPDDIVVGKIARLFKLKGHDDLFPIASALVKACPKWKFLFVGGGEWRARFEQMADAVGLKGHFVFTGLVPPGEIPGLVGIMDVLVHLSRREGLARALPQALAAGKPIVAYDCDGAREVCMDGETGFLIQPGDLPALERRLLQLAADAELRSRLGNCGRAWVRSRFSVETMIEETVRLYQELMAHGVSQ